MKKLAAIPLLALAFTASAGAFSPPNTYDLQIITGEGHQVTATWRSTEPSTFHCWLTTSGSHGSARGAQSALSLSRSASPARAGQGTPDANVKDADSVGAFRRLPCTPPKTYDGLAPGTYTLHVRAFGNESGLRETTPASGSFRIP